MNIVDLCRAAIRTPLVIVGCARADRRPRWPKTMAGILKELVSRRI